MTERLHVADTHDDVARMLAQFTKHAAGLPLMATKDHVLGVKHYEKLGISSFTKAYDLVINDVFKAYPAPDGEDRTTARIQRLMKLEAAALFLDQDTFLHLNTPINATRPNDDVLILRDSSPEPGVKHSLLLIVDRTPPAA